jgi:hypothetical protein
MDRARFRAGFRTLYRRAGKDFLSQGEWRMGMFSWTE